MYGHKRIGVGHGTMGAAIAAVVGLSWVVVAGGCANRNPLEPAPGATSYRGLDDAAQTRTPSVSLVAQADAWPSDDRILDDVTPLWVEVVNHHDRPITVRYEQFKLYPPDGVPYVARAPEETRGEAEVPIAGFAYGGYPRGYPYYDYAWDPWWGDYYGWGYYGWSPYYYTRYVRVPLPTPAMIQSALQEGVLAPGERAAGFVYFDRVDSDLGMVELTFTVIDAETGKVVDAASIPFEVEDIF